MTSAHPKPGGWRRIWTVGTAVIVLLSITANEAFACTDACLRKIGGVYTVDGVHYSYETCKSETVDNTVYITCYYG